LKRIMMVLTVMVIMVAMLVAMAVPAFAANSRDQVGPGNQGPPVFSGSLFGSPGEGARVDHCNASDGGEPGVLLTNRNGVHGNGNCYI
jgi:hypothetical protein